MMSARFRRWLPAALIAGACAASLWAGSRLPERVAVRFEGLLPFAIDAAPDPAPRWLAMWLMPALALLLFIAFRLAATTVGQRLGRTLFRHAPPEVTSAVQFERFGATYDVIVLGVVLLVVGLHTALLAAALQSAALAARIVAAVLGVSLVLMGNVMPRLRPNWVAGLRTNRLLRDPQLWRRAHRVFGAAVVGSGIITIVAALAAPQYGLLVAIGSLLAAGLIGWLASKRTNGAELRASIMFSLLFGAAGSASAQMPAPTAPGAPGTVAESNVDGETCDFALSRRAR